MLHGLIITDEELLDRICEQYDRHDIVEMLSLDAYTILTMFWDKVQDQPDIFSDVLTKLDYERDSYNDEWT
tara:strand:- start:3363 stop:3575 length:213 start_codon:yes stop_codon:yes gene_type:complete